MEWIGIKDVMLTDYMLDEERCADLINGGIFNGEQVLNPKYLEYEPRKKSVINRKSAEEQGEKITSDNGITENAEKKSTEEKITDYLEYEERERDIIRYYEDPEKKFYVSCEAQSKADYTMPLREFLNDGIEYMNQLKTGRHKETVEGKVKYLLPVFHMVLYHGWERWLSKHSLQEMMYLPEGLEKYQNKIPQYQSYIIDIHEQNPELYRTEWADVFRLMGKSRKKEELKKYMEEHMREIRALSKDTRMLLDQYRIMEDGKVEVKDVCEAWDGAMQMYAEEAAEKTRKEVMQEKEEAVNKVKQEASKEKEEAVNKVKQEAAKEKEEVINKVKQEAEKEKNEIEKIAEKFHKLLCILSKKQKYDDLQKVLDDQEYCEYLYVRYGI